MVFTAGTTVEIFTSISTIIRMPSWVLRGSVLTVVDSVLITQHATMKLVSVNKDVDRVTKHRNVLQVFHVLYKNKISNQVYIF